MQVIKRIKIQNKTGIHLRAAAIIVRVASRYKCRIWVQCGHRNADGKSIISILALAAACGSIITLTFNGDDSSAAAEELSALFESTLMDF